MHVFMHTIEVFAFTPRSWATVLQNRPFLHVYVGFINTISKRQLPDVPALSYYLTCCSVSVIEEPDTELLCSVVSFLHCSPIEVDAAASHFLLSFRVVYYVENRQVYSMQYQTVYRCCPGWVQLGDDKGCLYRKCSSFTVLCMFKLVCQKS